MLQVWIIQCHADQIIYDSYLPLKVIALSYDWTFNGRAETVKCVFDVLSVCSVVPRVQLALCEKFDLLDEANAVGMNVILGSAEGEIVPDSPDVQRAALLLLTHLLCGPVIRLFHFHILYLPLLLLTSDNKCQARMRKAPKHPNAKQEERKCKDK